MSERTSYQVGELRDLLAHGGLRGRPRVTIGDTVTADADLAVRAVLANIDALTRGEATTPARCEHAEEALKAVYHAVRDTPVS